MSSINRSAKSSETIIFKCDQNVAVVSENLRSFYEENEFFDAVIKAGSDCVTIQAHKVVLCSLSGYFLEIFRGGQSALKATEVELKQIEASSLKLIIDFMYSGSIELSLETVGGILRIASFLKMKTLIDGCCKLIEKNINSTNSLNWFRLAYELSLPRVKAKSLECTYTHFEVISKENKELLMLSEDELKDLLFNENPHGDFEEDVFLAMVAWINHDKSNREHLLFQLLSMVRFQALTPKFIIENRKPVCKTVESYELICSWLQWHLSPETRSNQQQMCAFQPRKVPDKIAITRVFDNSSKINIQTFNPKSNSWCNELEASLPMEKRVSSVIEIDSKLIAVGGIGQTKKVQYLDLHTFEWINMPTMKNIRTLCQLVDLRGNLGVFGGDSNENSNSMEIYNFPTRQWQDLQPLCRLTKRSQIATHNGLLYILDLANGLLQTYDISLNKWTLKVMERDSTLKRFGFVAVEGFLYVIGGYCQGHSVKSVKRYNLSKDSWCEMASLPHARSFIRTTVFENKIIIGGSRKVFEYNLDTDTWNTSNISTIDNVCNIFTLAFKF